LSPKKKRNSSIVGENPVLLDKEKPGRDKKLLKNLPAKSRKEEGGKGILRSDEFREDSS